MRRNLAHFLLCAVVVLALSPIAATSPGVETPSPAQMPATPDWIQASTGSSCEGECNGSQEIFVGCQGTSASACCASLQSTCRHFNGVCTGDSEIVCQF
jgi:hypothetical protein